MRHFGTQTTRPLGLLLTLAVILSSLVLPPGASRANAWPPPFAPLVAQVSCVTPPAGMTAWYAGDGNTLDLQGGDSGTLVGNPGSVTFVAGKVA